MLLLIAFVAGIIFDRLFYDKMMDKLKELYGKLKAKL